MGIQDRHWYAEERRKMDQPSDPSRSRKASHTRKIEKPKTNISALLPFINQNSLDV